MLKKKDKQQDKQIIKANRETKKYIQFGTTVNLCFDKKKNSYVIYNLIMFKAG